MIRAKHVLVLGAVVVGCGGEAALRSEPKANGTASVVSPPAPTAAPVTPAPVEEPTPTKPTVADVANKTLAAIVEAQNARDAEQAASVYAPDAELVMPGPVPSVAPQRVTLTGREAIKNAYAELYRGAGNVKFGFSRVWVKDEVVVTEWVMTFQHAGNLMGMKATNRLAGMMGASVSWMTPDGLVKREHRYFDTATIAGQVGFSKEKVRPVVVSVPTSWETVIAREGDDKNVALLQKVYGTFESKTEADFLGALSERFVHDDYAEPEAARGKDAAQRGFADFTKAFPDSKLAVTHSFGAGDYAIAEVTFEGAQKGALGPLRASNKTVKVASLDIAKLDKDGKLAHLWTFGDQTDVMVQLGAVKPPPAPKPDKPAPAKK